VSKFFDQSIYVGVRGDQGVLREAMLGRRAWTGDHDLLVWDTGRAPLILRFIPLSDPGSLRCLRARWAKNINNPGRWADWGPARGILVDDGRVEIETINRKPWRRARRQVKAILVRGALAELRYRVRFRRCVASHCVVPCPCSFFSGGGEMILFRAAGRKRLISRWLAS